jgi:DNA-binding response OmpR family regulator
MALQGRILVVDDNIPLAENLAEVLEISGYQTFVARSAEDALDIVDSGVGALITDFRMPNKNGAELITEIRRRGSRIPALVMSGHSDDEMTSACTNAGALDVLPKPIVVERLLAWVAAL